MTPTRENRYETGTPRNPFRDITMRKEYAAAVMMFNARHRNFFLNGQPGKGNAFANNFWRGWNNVTENWDAASRQTLAWAYRRAGRDLCKLNKGKF